eukprot:jgi/Tetstr1/435908/TSEL_024794.t1
MARTSRVPGLRKRPGQWVQQRADGAAGCVPGLQKRPGHRVQRRPVGADQRHGLAAEATCTGGTWCSGGQLAPTGYVLGLRRRPGTVCGGRPMARKSCVPWPPKRGRRHMVEWRPDMAPTSCVPIPRKRTELTVQRRLDGADQLRV